MSYPTLLRGSSDIVVILGLFVSMYVEAIMAVEMMTIPFCRYPYKSIFQKKVPGVYFHDNQHILWHIGYCPAGGQNNDWH